MLEKKKKERKKENTHNKGKQKPQNQNMTSLKHVNIFSQTPRIKPESEHNMGPLTLMIF